MTFKVLVDPKKRECLVLPPPSSLFVNNYCHWSMIIMYWLIIMSCKNIHYPNALSLLVWPNRVCVGAGRSQEARVPGAAPTLMGRRTSSHHGMVGTYLPRFPIRRGGKWWEWAARGGNGFFFCAWSWDRAGGARLERWMQGYLEKGIQTPMARGRST